MFENKEVQYVNTKGVVVPCKVYACEEDVGITLIGCENDNKVLCINGPLSPYFKNEFEKSEYRVYFYHMFNTAVEMIKSGTIDGKKLPWDRNQNYSVNSEDMTCAFD